MAPIRIVHECCIASSANSYGISLADAKALKLHEVFGVLRNCCYICRKISTMTEESMDIRWKQRFQNFENAYGRLRQGVLTLSREPENELIFQSGYIKDGEEWLHALQDRNMTVHTYDAETAAAVVADICSRYVPMLTSFYEDFKARL